MEFSRQHPEFSFKIHLVDRKSENVDAAIHAVKTTISGIADKYQGLGNSCNPKPRSVQKATPSSRDGSRPTGKGGSRNSSLPNKQRSSKTRVDEASRGQGRHDSCESLVKNRHEKKGVSRGQGLDTVKKGQEQHDSCDSDQGGSSLENSAEEESNSRKGPNPKSLLQQGVNYQIKLEGPAKGPEDLKKRNKTAQNNKKGNVPIYDVELVSDAAQKLHINEGVSDTESHDSEEETEVLVSVLSCSSFC